MGRLALLVWISAGLIAASVARPAAAQEDSLTAFIAEESLNNVVRIEAGPEKGAGFIVSREGDLLWIATAAHVVLDDEAEGQLERRPRRPIKVWTRSRAEPFTADGRVYESPGDIALIALLAPVREAGPDRWKTQLIEADPPDRAPVRLGATPSEIAYGPWSGALRQSNGALTVEGFSRGQAGQSGAPVFAGRGIIGMYVAAAGERFVPIGVIEAAARDARIRWDLTPYPPRPTAIRLCLDVEGAPATELRVNSGDRLQAPDAQGCLPAASGQARILSKSGTYRCTPATPNLPRMQEQRLAIRCDLELAGVWSAGSRGILTIEDKGEGLWSASGLELAPFGPIAGSLTRVGNRLAFSGRGRFGQPVQGEFEAASGRLKGFLLPTGGPVELELSR